MFFGSAMIASAFATHPPLAVRVRRIDPQFDGVFPKVSAVLHRATEIIDPHSLSFQRSSLQQAHVAAIAGAEHLQQQPGDVVASIGEPSSAHIRHARGLVESLTPVLADDLRDPLGATAVIYGLLLAKPDSDVRDKQMVILAKQSNQPTLQEIHRVLPTIDRLAAEQRLPVACMALPALLQMSPPQIQSFYLMVRELIQIDSDVSIFEFAVHRYIAKRVLTRLRPGTVKQEGNLGFAAVHSEFSIVLAFLARLGNAQRSSSAVAAGLSALGMDTYKPNLPDVDQCTLKALDAALDRLSLAAPKLKKRLLNAFAACIAEDSHVSIEETELLRVIADALGCPIPPVLNLSSVGQATKRVEW
jgi:hypothetical protein